MTSPLVELIERGRIVVCAGCGGVGKTTTAAALAIAAASRGRRVLALTIDPAQRLSASLGLKGHPNTPTPVVLQGAAQGNLQVMIHDAKATFDALIKKHASHPEVAERILRNPLYAPLSSKVAGVGEYMAIEKLLELQQSGQFDLIVLDTPPTRNALDFLSAPERMADAIGSGAGRWLIRAFAAPQDTQRGLLRRGVARALKGLGKLSSSAFLEDFATLLAELDELFNGFRQRSEQASTLLAGPDVSYLVVSTPEALALEEAQFFLEHLELAGRKPGVLLVNRVRGSIDLTLPVSALLAELGRLGVALEADAETRIGQVLEQEQAWAALDHARVQQAQRMVSTERLCVVPALRIDLNDVAGLTQLSRLLLA